MKATLILEDGTFFHGTSFTGEGQSHGEVIFNTGMSGYQEILTDPSYTGQMLCMTYPLIGNYGINCTDIESDSVHVAGLIVKECCKNPSNWQSTETLADYLSRHNIMGIENIDTRALTRHLRIHGAMRGFITTKDIALNEVDKLFSNIPLMQGQNLADNVSIKELSRWENESIIPLEISEREKLWKSDDKLKVIVYDFGTKWNIFRLLEEQGFQIIIVPADTLEETVRSFKPDAVFFSNGPGDPATLTHAVTVARSFCEDLPVAGICLGHQILGQALGGKTYKLKFGHHGCNHPVMNLKTNKIEISSQNHGFCVDISDIKDLEVTHINLNDKTLEGFAHKTKPIIAIQFHPESAPGPHDSQYFFARFKNLVQDSLK